MQGSGAASTWACASSGDGPRSHMPAFYNNAALARYQCGAWIPAVQQFGFDGIHWDTFMIPDSAAGGAAAFVATAKGLLSKATPPLLQTFNDISMKFGISATPSYFSDGTLAFPYTEVWTNAEEDACLKLPLPSAVIAAYPGGKFGCPPGGGEELPQCCAPSPTAGCWDMNQVATLRCQRYRGKARYCLVGVGVDPAGDKEKAVIGMLVNEYFPFVAPVAAGIKACLVSSALGQ